MNADLYWHYTSASGLLGILGSHSVWATNAAALNDATELSYAVDRVNELIDSNTELLLKEAVVVPAKADELVKFIPELVQFLYQHIEEKGAFVFCASDDGDSLSQWRGYGGGGEPGFAVGLGPATSLHLNIGSRDGATSSGGAFEYENVTMELTPAWRPVIYDRADQETRVNRFLILLAQKLATVGNPLNHLDPEAATSSMLAELIREYAELATSIKHPAFRDERESRIALCGAGPAEASKIRVGKYGPVPYVSLAAPRTTPSTEPVARTAHRDFLADGEVSLPILAVRAGPSPEPDLAAQGARWALDHFGYTEVEVLPSQIPFR